MRILVTGGRGQLGRSLARRGPAAGHAIVALGSGELDVTDPAAIEAALDRAAPDAVIHAAAYTAVDRAESEPARAFAVNAEGAGIVARAAARRGLPLLHVSTDYVFDGAATAPIPEDAPLAPLGVYGASKAAGEALVRQAGGTVVRTSWLFAAGGPGFVQTITRLARERAALRVVDDQRGCPTWAEDLAEALLALAARADRPDVVHVAGDGPTTWHALATAVVAEARRHAALACERIEAIPTAAYPTPARRPAYSVLDTSRARALGLPLAPWGPGLARTLAEDLGAGAPPR